MMLLVDLGNSFIKWAFAHEGDWRTGRSLHVGQSLSTVLDMAWEKGASPGRIVACSVAPADTYQTLSTWCTSHWGIAPERMVATARFAGVLNAYREPAQLGADRWAALIAARAMVAGDVAVVDCGTAVTIDFLAASGEHQGGVIIPGLSLLQSSLRSGTSAIRETDGDAESVFARSTADGVAAGTAVGLVGAIAQVLDAFGRGRNDATWPVLLTGGDAEFVASRLHRATRVVPDLVLLGLKEMATNP